MRAAKQLMTATLDSQAEITPHDVMGVISPFLVFGIGTSGGLTPNRSAFQSSLPLTICINKCSIDRVYWGSAISLPRT